MSDDVLPTLLLATSNEGKRREMEALLDSVARIVTFRDVGLSSPAEVGTTFAENASIKAAFGADATQLPTLADDSGLVVDALGGTPGIYSARFAGPHATDAENREHLRHLMTSIPVERRAARFRAAVAVALPGQIVDIYEAALEGAIGLEERGEGGFGYDSLFLLPNGCTLAELSSEDKNHISHRGQAVRLALPTLLRILRDH